MNILFATTVNELEIYALLTYQTARTDNFLTSFLDNLLVPSSRGKNPKRKPAVRRRSLSREEYERCIVLSSIVLANRIEVIGEEGKCSSQCSFEFKKFY